MSTNKSTEAEIRAARNYQKRQDEKGMIRLPSSHIDSKYNDIIDRIMKKHNIDSKVKAVTFALDYMDKTLK